MARMITSDASALVPVCAPNNSWWNTEAVTVNKIPFSTDYLSGPFEAFSCPQDKISLMQFSSVNPQKLELTNIRRPFFQDKHVFLVNEVDKSRIHTMPYYGSGTLAFDECSASAALFNGSAAAGSWFTGMRLDEINSTLARGERLGSLMTSGWSAFFGSKREGGFSCSTFDSVSLAKAVGGVDSWLGGITKSGYTEEDNIWIVQRNGFGRNMQLALFIVEDWSNKEYNALFNPLGIVSSVYPNLHRYAINPQQGSGGTYKTQFRTFSASPFLEFDHVSGTPTAESASAIHEIASSHAIPVYYSVVSGDDGQLTADIAALPCDFFGEAFFGTSRNATVGSRSNVGNNGGNTVIIPSHTCHQKIQINFSGLPGVHKVTASYYLASEISKRHYYSYSSLIPGVSVQDIIGDVYESLNTNINGGINIASTFGISPASYTCNNHLIVDIKNNKTVNISSLEVSTYTLGDPLPDGRIPHIYTGIYPINALSGGVSFKLTVNYMSEDIKGIFIGGQFTPPVDWWSGVSYQTAFEGKYPKLNNPNNNDDVMPSSPYLGVIHERLAVNQYNLKPIALGICSKFFDKGISELFSSDYSDGLSNPERNTLHTRPHQLLLQQSGNSLVMKDGVIQPPPSVKELQDDYSMGPMIIQHNPFYSRYLPKGWHGFMLYVIIGENSADVISKMRNLYSSGELDREYTSNEIPQVIKDSVIPSKEPNIW